MSSSLCSGSSLYIHILWMARASACAWIVMTAIKVHFPRSFMLRNVVYTCYKLGFFLDNFLDLFLSHQTDGSFHSYNISF